MPASLAAVAFVISVIHGFAFLRAVEAFRSPRAPTALTEVLELTAVGLGTTGVSCAVFLFADPTSVEFVLDADPTDLEQLRTALLILLQILLLAVAIALLLSVPVRALAIERYSPGVWKSSLGTERAGHVPHAAVEVDSGITFDGPLHAYSFSDTEPERDVALKAPIRASKSGREINTEYDYLVIPATQIRHIALRHVADTGGIRPPLVKRSREWIAGKVDDARSPRQMSSSADSSKPNAKPQSSSHSSPDK